MIRECLLVASLPLFLVGCGGSAPAATSPEPTPQAGDVHPPPVIEDAPGGAVVEQDPAPPEVTPAALPCPGKDPKYWDTGAVKSEVLTEDCTVNGRSFKAGTRIEFDENGQLQN